ncbi:hypothetical protein WMF31_41685 [Sorangium sp. So ce1036]|uniref:hypothetical protein n=1 Tax=Sorangium sp. So ce1036 TaxID=3133328 RepID=UPI003F0BBB43
MLQPLPGLLAAVDPFLSGLLASPAARRRIAERAASLPPIWSQSCIECRLTAQAEERCDVMFCSSRQDGGQRALAARLRSSRPIPELGRAHRFWETWADPESEIGRNVPVVWLEIDDTPDDRAPDPFVFMTLDPLYGSGVRASAGLPPERARALAEEGLLLMLDDAPDRAALDLFERCARLLPEGGYMLHLTTMPQRGSRDLRVSAVMAVHEISSWLGAIGWPGDARTLALVLDLLDLPRGQLAVHFELGDAVRPTVALDFRPRARPNESSVWRALLERLVDLGVCDRGRGQAALDWMGTQLVDLPEAAWSMHVQRDLFFKLRVQPDGSLEIKAYLGILSSYAVF